MSYEISSFKWIIESLPHRKCHLNEKSKLFMMFNCSLICRYCEVMSSRDEDILEEEKKESFYWQDNVVVVWYECFNLWIVFSLTIINGCIIKDNCDSYITFLPYFERKLQVECAFRVRDARLRRPDIVLPPQSSSSWIIN